MAEVQVDAVMVLAAGEGTRMRSRLPKVLHEVAGRSLLGHVVDAVGALQPTLLAVVVGSGADAVRTQLAGLRPDAQAIVQERRGGTGHAVQLALAALPGLVGTVLVTAGDTPLLRAVTLIALAESHAESAAAATVLTARLADPSGYGRIIRADGGAVDAIVEERDATDAQRAVNEVNSGVYAFAVEHLRSALGELTSDNAQGELYLTDVLSILRRRGLAVAAHGVTDATEILGVNDRRQLAEAGAILRQRAADAAMSAGVTIVDPSTTWLDVSVGLEPDVTLLPGTRLHGRTTVGTGAIVGPDTTAVDCVIGAGAVVRSSTCEGATIGPDSVVGPYSYLRAGAVLGRGAKVGAFVEVKQSSIGDGAKVPHLSYVGDATIGRGSNIGAATIFANYDGVAKHRTVVGEDVRTGSDTVLVAPVTVGDGAYTAAGSVITQDVPPGALGLGRARQHTVTGWVARRRAGTSSAARAASAASAATAAAAADSAGAAHVPAPAPTQSDRSTDHLTSAGEPTHSDSGRPTA